MPDTSVFIEHVIYTHMIYMSRCIPAIDKISIMSGLCPAVLYTYLILSGYWYTTLSGSISALAWNGSCRTLCRISDHYTKTILFSTVFQQLLSNGTIFVSNCYCIPKNCANMVLFNTGCAVCGIVITVRGQSRNAVQNGTVWYSYDTVYRQCGIGAISIIT